MNRAVAAAILCVITVSLTWAQPAAESVSDIRAYTSAMRGALADIGVLVKRIDSPRNELLVVYTLGDDAPLPEFAVAAVLRLSAPLGQDAEQIRIRNVRGGDTLLELQVRPEQVGTVLASTVDDAQREEIDALLSEVLAASGVEDLQVPQSEASGPTQPGARVKQQGAVPVDESDLTAQAAPRQTRPAETFGEQQIEDQPEGPPVAPEDVPEVAATLTKSLAHNDLENISVARDAAERWIISFENRTWRSDMEALERALEATAEVLPATPVILQIKRHDVVVSSVHVELADYVKLQAEILTADELAANWRVSAGPAQVTEPVEVLAQGNESHLRTDLMWRPAIDYTIGLENDPFESDYFLVTDARTTIAPGLWTQLRFPGQLTTDQRITMDRALLGWVGRPTEGVLATASWGRFEDQLHGFYAEARTDTDEHQVGLVGSLTERGFHVNPFEAYDSAFAYYQYDWGKMGLKTRLGYGQFLESGDLGVTLSLRRRFGESTIEARAIRTDEGDEGLTFELSLPLGPRQVSSPEDVRLRPNPRARVDYTSNFNAQGDYLRGSHDLESFRGELSPAYVGAHGQRLAHDDRSAVKSEWPAAPSFEGNSGLMRVPTADVAPDGRLFAGISYFDRDHSKVAADDTDAMPTFIGAGFLPNLELVGRLTFFHDVKAFHWNYNLDRSFNAHFRLNRQRGDWFPAFAVGAQDVTFGTNASYLGDAEYIVGTLRRDSMRAHLGVGSGKFDPLFAGFEMAVENGSRLHLMAEYDSDYVNAGARWFLEDWGTASIGLLGLKDLTGSVTFQTELR